MSTVMGGGVAKAGQKKKRMGPPAQSSDPMCTACISCGGVAHVEERAQNFESLPYDQRDQDSTRGVVVVVAAATTSVVDEGSHTDSMVREAQSPAPDLALGEAADSDT